MENNKIAATYLLESTSKTSLTFGEIWVLTLLCRLVDDKDADYLTYTIPLKDLQPFLDLDVRGTSSALLGRGVKFSSESSTFETNLLNSFEYVTADEPLLLFTIHPKMKPFLSKFKSLEALDLSLLNLGVSQRIFTILVFTMLKSQTTHFFDLEKLKIFLGISDKYTLFSNFKIKILEESRRRIEEEIGLSFDYDEVKKGKKVSAIRFRLNEIRVQSLFAPQPPEGEFPEHVRETFKVSLTSDTPFPKESGFPSSTVSTDISTENSLPKSLILEQLKPTVCTKFGVTPKMLKKLVDGFSLETLRQAIVLTEKAIENGKIKGSAAGFFVEATRQNYQPLGNTPSVKDDIEQKRQAEMRQKAKELAHIEKQEKQARDAVKKQEFEQERDVLLAELATDETLRNAVVERIKYSLFYLSFDETKTFEGNLENPSFLAAVLNFSKMIKMER